MQKASLIDRIDRCPRRKKAAPVNAPPICDGPTAVRPERRRTTPRGGWRCLRLLCHFAVALRHGDLGRGPGATGLVGALVFGLLACSASGSAFAEAALLRSLGSLARPFSAVEDLSPLIETAGRARLVLLGEASHGTHEFYAWRDRVSRRLIEEQGFSFVAIEGDWATLLPLDRYVRHRPGSPRSARDALRTIRRWPRWVWANTELETFAEWLHQYNAGRLPHERIGIHGIDLYAVWESLGALRDRFADGPPKSAGIVHRLIRILMPFRDRPRAYGRDDPRHHRVAQQAIAQLLRDSTVRLHRTPPAQRERLFEVLQHVRVVDAGTRYLRLLPGPPAWSWNVRSDHFDQTVRRLLDRYGPGSRAIVWAHNTHIGDARATPAGLSGEHSLGELARSRYGDDAVFLIGLGAGRGQLLAARRWEGRRETMSLPEPREDSLESALLASGSGRRWLMLEPRVPATGPLHRWLPHRAVGVVFDPDHEARENYVPTLIDRRYDAFVFFPETRPLTPLSAD